MFCKENKSIFFNNNLNYLWRFSFFKEFYNQNIFGTFKGIAKQEQYVGLVYSIGRTCVQYMYDLGKKKI